MKFIENLLGSGNSANLVKVDEHELGNLRGQLKAIHRSQAVIEFTPEGTILDANHNFLDAMGYSLGEIKGQHHSMFIDAEYRGSPEYRSFWSKLARGEFESGVFKRLGKGGREVWIQASYCPILNDENKTFKVVKYATDITADMEKKLKSQDELNRVFAALGSTSSNVMVADNNRIVVYMNAAVEKM